MNSKFLSLPLLLASLCLPAWAGSLAFVPGGAPPQHKQLLQHQADAGAAPRSIRAQQVATSDEVRREEALGERRLSASELAELRQQVRQQWASAPEAAARAPEPSSVERMLPGQAAKGAATAAPRGQRP